MCAIKKKDNNEIIKCNIPTIEINDNNNLDKNEYYKDV